MIIQALFAGKPQPFGPRKSPSSIVKHPYDALDIGPEGALQDEQGNKKLHGGPEMALHHYSHKGYEQLKLAFPEAVERFQIGSIGENLSCGIMNDENVFIGDIYRMGEVLVQVSSPRAPCVKINQRYGLKNADLLIAEQGITGWYYRIIETGKVFVGGEISLEHRLRDTISIKQLMRIVRSKKSANQVTNFDQAQAAQQTLERRRAASIQALSKEWVRKLKA